MTNDTIRHRVYRRTENRTAGEALTLFASTAGGDAVGFCYSPFEARWFRLDDAGQPGDGTGPVDLTGVFELRAFTTTHELRWLNTSGGHGNAVIVTDVAAVEDLEPGLHADGVWTDGDLTYERLLWGVSREPASGGWLALDNGRVGELRVPVSGPAGSDIEVWLTAVEYAVADGHGNVSIVDERLTGLVTRPRHDKARPENETNKEAAG